LYSKTLCKENKNHTQPLFYGRFIDDCFGVWTGSRAELDSFIQTHNEAHPTIRFTAEISETSVSFLDTRVNLAPDGTLHTDLYTKPTDSHNYLLFSSAHPRHCLNGIPYGQFLRARRRRICSRISDFEKHAVTLAHHFIRRGYPPDLIEESLIKAHRQDRHSLLNPPPQSVFRVTPVYTELGLAPRLHTPHSLGDCLASFHSQKKKVTGYNTMVLKK
jgi:hypothetical protein